MARIRTIKPDFWTNARVIECSTNARLLFIGMWNFADDKGRLPFLTKTLKAQIFPADDFSSDDISRMIDELSTNGLVSIYYVEEKGYLQVTGWAHQRIDRPQPSKYPDPSQNDRRTFAPDLKGVEGKVSNQNQDGAKAPIVDLFPKTAEPPSQEKSYFDRSKEILGPKGNGLAAKLKNHMAKQGKPISAARAVMETAAGASNPAEYIGRVIAGRARDEMGASMQPGYGDEWG